MASASVPTMSDPPPDASVAAHAGEQPAGDRSLDDEARQDEDQDGDDPQAGEDLELADEGDADDGADADERGVEDALQLLAATLDGP